MRGPVLKQAPTDVPGPRPFLKETPPTFRSSRSTLQRGTNPSRFIRCTMHLLRGACMCMAPNSISISLVKMWRCGTLRTVDCYWEEAVVQPQCFVISQALTLLKLSDGGVG